MALSEEDKTDLRFFLGYAMVGDDPNSLTNAYPHQLDVTLEDHMRHLTSSEENKVKELLDELREMDAEIKAARATLNIDTAGAFKKNKAELRDRISLYNYTRKQLGTFLQVPLRN
jgi:hypothetical protein